MSNAMVTGATTGMTGGVTGMTSGGNGSALLQFLSTFPLSFENWTLSAQLQHFSTGLSDFASLDNSTKLLLVDNFSHGLAQVLKQMLAASMALLPQNIMEPARYLLSLNGYFTTTTVPPPDDPLCLQTMYQSNEGSQNSYTFHVAAGVAILIIFILSFLKRRKNACPNCCYRRPGLPYPVNFLDEYERRWAFMAALAGASSTVLNIFTKNYYWKPAILDDPDFKWVSVFVAIVNVAEACVVFYPFLACVAHRRHLVANILGVFYSIGWIYVYIEIFTIRCPVWEHARGRHSATVWIEVSMDVPLVLSFICCLISYVMDFIINLRDRGLCCCQKQLKETKSSRALKYTKFVFNTKPTPVPEGLKKKLIHRVKTAIIYRKLAGFRYSPRVVCTMAVCFFTLYKFTTMMTILVDYYIGIGLFVIGEAREGLSDVVPHSVIAIIDLIYTVLDICRLLVWISSMLSFAIQIVFMFLTTFNYRKHLRMTLQGQHSWMNKITSSPSGITVSSVRYSGYQIAYTLWGYAMMAIILFIAQFILTFFLILPLINKESSFLIEALKRFWPTLLLSLALYFSQVLLAKFAFLQERGKWLALNNRHVFHTFVYFFFFFNVLVGLFAALKRILISFVLGAVFLSRLDRNVFMKDVRKFDSGFKAYMGMVVLEASHTNPIMRSFILLLQERVAITRSEHFGTTKATLCNGDVEQQHVHHYKANDTPMQVSRSRQAARFRWLLAYTLLKNPNITFDRLAKRRHMEMEQNRENVKARESKIGSQVSGGLKSLHSVTSGLLKVGTSAPPVADKVEMSTRI